MTAAMKDRLEELTAERQTAAEALRQAADSLDTARLSLRAGTGLQAALEAAESRHRAAVGVHAQIVAEHQNAADDRAISDRLARLDAMQTEAMARSGLAQKDVSQAIRNAVAADLVAVTCRVELRRSIAAARIEHNQVEQIAESYAREIGRLLDTSSQLDAINTREGMLREWNLPVDAPPYDMFPPVYWPASEIVDQERYNHGYNLRTGAASLMVLAGLK